MNETHYVGKQNLEQQRLPELLELLSELSWRRNDGPNFELYFENPNPQISESEINFRIDYKPKGQLDREYYITCPLFNPNSLEICRQKTEQEIEKLISTKFFQYTNFRNCPHTGYKILTNFGGKNTLQTLITSDYRLKYLSFDIGDTTGDTITITNNSKRLQILTQNIFEDNKKIISKIAKKFGLEKQKKLQ